MSTVFDLAEWQRRGPDAFPPQWASAWGDDHFGPWADLQVAGEVQRLRWIEAGGHTDWNSGCPRNSMSFKRQAVQAA
jgi:hypothetical protein